MTRKESPLAPSLEAPLPTRLARRWPLLAAVLAAHVLASLLIALVIELDGDEPAVGLVLGVLFAQITLLAVWTAWAPVTFFVRLTSGLLLTGGVALSLAALILRDSQEAEPAVMFGIILFSQWLLAQAPLWFLRATRGQRLVQAEAWDTGESAGELQFGVGQLLILTACVALLLGAARMISPGLADEFRNDWANNLKVLALFASFNLLVPLPAIWAAFARSTLLWLAAAAGYAACVTAAESFAFGALLGPGPDSNIFIWINTPFFLIAVGTLLAFRSCGFQVRTNAESGMGNAD